MVESCGQPRPDACFVEAFAGRNGNVRSIVVRWWIEGSASACTLCPECRAIHVPKADAHVCAVSVAGFLGDDEAGLHRFNEAEGDELLESRVVDRNRVDGD